MIGVHGSDTLCHYFHCGRTSWVVFYKAVSFHYSVENSSATYYIENTVGYRPVNLSRMATQGSNVTLDVPDTRSEVRPAVPARVSLPPGPEHWVPAPVNPYYGYPSPPNVATYDHSFPALGESRPHVNIPAPYHPTRVAQANNFEDQLRGMILNNDSNRQPSPSLPGGLTQVQRTQKSGQMNGNASQLFNGSEVRLAPHLRGLRSPQVSLAKPHPNNSSEFFRYVNHQPGERPPPQKKQLYNPMANGLRPYRPDHHQTPHSTVSAAAQIGYLDLAACQILPKVQMSLEEHDEKEDLRIVLEQVCRKAVFEYETVKNADHLEAKTIELKCFGSMSTTFATKSSDMDLVLVSPLSEPDISSPESEIPRLVEKALLDSGYGARLLTKTRVPIIRFCQNPTTELKDLLLKERAKFEVEQETVQPVSKRSAKKAKRAKENKPDPTLPQNRPAGSSSPTTDANGLSSESPVNGEKPAVQIETSKGNGPSSSQNLKPETAKDPVSQEPKSPIPLAVERTDPSLAGKSDEERARLYRLAIQEGWYEPAERKVIIDYMQTVNDKKATEEEKARIRDSLGDLPNVIGRYRPPPEAHPLEFPKNGVGIQCDINFSNHLALHNSQLLKCYSLCDPRVRQMVLFVKAWSKKRKVNNPYHGTLSSYGYVLMVLHYLVNVARPPVIPNLQQVPLAFEDELSSKMVECDGHNVRFLRNEVAIQMLIQQKAITHNTETVGSLLHGFFYYFAQQGYRSPAGGFAWSLDVLSLRTIGGLIPKKVKGWTGAKTETVELNGSGPQQTKDIRQRYLFAIEDPFEIEHNIARTVVHNGIVAIRDEFRRAQRLIEHAGVMPGNRIENLLAEAEDKEHLQYRAFGPRLRPRGSPENKGVGVTKVGETKQVGVVSTHGVQVT